MSKRLAEGIKFSQAALSAQDGGNLNHLIISCFSHLLCISHRLNFFLKKSREEKQGASAWLHLCSFGCIHSTLGGRQVFSPASTSISKSGAVYRAQSPKQQREAGEPVQRRKASSKCCVSLLSAQLVGHMGANKLCVAKGKGGISTSAQYSFDMLGR